MNTINKQRVCDCCGCLMTITFVNPQICECGVEYWTDENGCYVNVLNLMEMMERI